MKTVTEIRPILSALMRSKTGAILVALQVALSLAILSNALHIVNVRQAVAARPSGVADEAQVFYVEVRNLKLGGNNEQLATHRAQQATLAAVPGVVAVTEVSQVPLSRSGSTSGVAADPRQKATSADAAMYFMAGSAIRTWGLQLREGRDFQSADYVDIDQNTDAKMPTVVIITRALAEKVWPGEASVIGKALYQGLGPKATAMRVIGVVERLQTQSAEIGGTGEYSLLMPARLTGDPRTLYAARAEPGQRDRVMKEAEAALRRASAQPLLIETDSMQADRARRYRADLALAWMLIAISVLLLLITASGIVGIASLWVTQRRKQIGVRRALGARRIDILRYFLTENVMITSAGIVLGFLLALGLNQLLVSQLELARLPLAYPLAGALLFWVLGIAAVYGPAWRAASISPATATRGA